MFSHIQTEIQSKLVDEVVIEAVMLVRNIGRGKVKREAKYVSELAW